jgi:hypothetical protein
MSYPMLLSVAMLGIFLYSGAVSAMLLARVQWRRTDQ